MRLTFLIVFALVVLVLGMIVTDATDAAHAPATTTTTAIPPVFDAPISDQSVTAPVVVERPEVPRSHTTAPIVRSSESSTWDRLADCESGEWDRNRNPVAGSANWASTSDGYEGGVHFTNGTWLGAGGGDFASHANLASRDMQITVAKVVLRRQGVRAWPVCGPKVGLTMADAA